MPIGTVDYTSSAAWNDPYNPWPAYAQVSLSAADENLSVNGAPLIMQLEDFDPTPGEQNWSYISLNALNDTVYMIYNSDSNQVTISDPNVSPYYSLPTTVRSVPAGWQQGNTNWVTDGGADVNTLSIVPVTTYLNPWEYRRRRTLEYI